MDISKYKRVFVIGDIHGWYRPLVNLLSAINPGPRDKIITLGDYVDRGPENPLVLEALIKLYRQRLLIPLRGNHDQGMMDASFSQEALLNWRDNLQGKSTLRTYGVQTDTLREFKEKVPEEHIWFLTRALRNYLELEDFICVHGGVHPRLMMEDQSPQTLQWTRFQQHQFPHLSGKVVCCGHSAVGEWPKVDLFGRAVCVDTNMGVSDDGWLTALDLNSGLFIQTDRVGNRRASKLDWPVQL